MGEVAKALGVIICPISQVVKGSDAQWPWEKRASFLVG